jgi:hypothetical protein
VKTRRLTIAGGSRKSDAANAALAAVIDWVRIENGKGVKPTQNGIADGLKDSEYKKPTIVAAVKLGIKLGRITTTDGPNKSKLHTVLELRNTLHVTFEDTLLINEGGNSIASVLATCTRCLHTTESFGVKEASRKRCLALMGEECPKNEKNFYAEHRRDPDTGSEDARGSTPIQLDDPGM